MQNVLRTCAVAVTLAIGAPNAALASELIVGGSVESLLDYAKERNPEYAGMRHEADAAGERIGPAGALPDPRLRLELMDITRAGEQSPTLSPSRVGSTVYTLMQDVPWFGKRDLKRDIAALEADDSEWAAQQLAKTVTKATIVFIVCDRGDRYLSTGVFPA